MNVLFSRVGIFDVIQHQKEQFKSAFLKVSNAELDADTDGVVALLVEQFSIDVPVLDVEHKYAQTKETQVDVSGDPSRFIRDRSRPFYIAGTEITFIVPFSGDAGVFDIQPSSFTVNPPSANVRDRELHLVYEVTNPQFNVEADADRNIAFIQQHLAGLRPSAEQLQTELRQLATSLLERRKQERGTHSQIISGLTTPVREVPPAPVPASTPIYPPARRRAAQKKKEDQWDVFISHATEDKQEIARPLSDALKGKGLRVWYDEFSLKLGDSLRQSIERGLARSLFGVVILSPHFFEKHWTQQELNGLSAREVEGEKVILPVWHKIDAEGVRLSSPMLADRKAVHTDQGLEIVVQQIMEVVRPT
jgi:hypothetical protein